MAGGRVASLDEPADAARVIDAGGRTAVPGLVDAHVHLIMGGEALGRLDLSGVRSRDEFEAAIAARHEQLPPGRWLIAHGWSEENWAGRAVPDKRWLASASRPVVCHRQDLHAALVNDAVLARCDTSHDPPGGRIERDPASGEPTGLMVEAAAWTLVNPLVPRPEVAEQGRALMAAQTHLFRHGVTTVGTMEYARTVREVFEPARGRLRLRCRVILLDRGWPMDFEFGRRFVADEHLAVIGYKTFIDGTLGSRTARMFADYADDPGNRGLIIELAAQDNLNSWARAVAEAGFCPCLHAIGDEANRIALDAVEPIKGRSRCRIEHAQTVDEADVARFRDVIASMQPLHKADDGRSIDRRLGPGRRGRVFPFRRLLAAGARLAFGSDWPVVSCDPLLGVRAAVTGLTTDGELFAPGENLTVDETLRAYTAGAAHAVGLDDAGVLRPGGLGDVVVLDRDPFEADWVRRPPKVVMTIAGGEVVYDER